MMRTNRSTIVLIGAILLILLVASLGYSHRDNIDLSSFRHGTTDDSAEIIADNKPNKEEKPAKGKESDKGSEKASEKEEETDEETDEEMAEEAEEAFTGESGVSVQDPEGIFDLLKDIHKDIVKPTDKKYTPYGAFSWDIPKDWQPKFTKKMGEDICIIDIDNRPFDENGQAFGESMSWDDTDKLHGISLGLLNHWLYAKLHGYKYYFVTFDTPKDRRSSWEKPYIISKLLAKHKTCVYIDSDAIFYHLDLPLEWLMNYWKIDPKQHSFSLSWDPNFAHNKDEFGQLYFNTGFIILQNSKKTFQILKDWDECTNEGGKYPGCTSFRFNEFGRPTDQGGFGTYVRYDYEAEIKALPCSEANGFPEDPSECKGKFIRHMWSGKSTLIKVVTGHQFPGKFLPTIQSMFTKEKDQFYFAKKDLK